jgi:uncharacterized protein YndB with AHSA1/START domain
MDIIHGLDIETTADKLFEALSTDKGVAAWWTKAKTHPEVGSLNEFAFGPGAVTFRVEKLEPGKAVAWSAEQVPPDWKGTKVLFELSNGDKAGSVTLRFSHLGFKTLTPVVAFTSYAWAQFLRSLKLAYQRRNSTGSSTLRRWMYACCRPAAPGRNMAPAVVSSVPSISEWVSSGRVGARGARGTA